MKLPNLVSYDTANHPAHCNTPTAGRAGTCVSLPWCTALDVRRKRGGGIVGVQANVLATQREAEVATHTDRHAAEMHKAATRARTLFSDRETAAGSVPPL